jgi:hypothetical protein
VVQLIDNFARNHRLGNILEAKVGQGSLLICSIDLAKDLESRPAARQLLGSLQTYAGSAAFQPKQALELEVVEKLLAGKNRIAANVAAVKADSEQADYEAAKALDGDPATMWHTAWEGQRGKGMAYPHEISIEFVKPAKVGSLSVLPRQDNNRNGWIREYEAYASADGKAWGQPVAQGSFTADKREKTIKLAQPVEAKFLKLVAKSGFGRQGYASIAELTVKP